jgi:hypothetical protein
MEVALEEEETQKTGLAVIVDMEGYSLKLFRWLTPSNLRISSRKLYVSNCIGFLRWSVALRNKVGVRFPGLPNFSEK